MIFVSKCLHPNIFVFQDACIPLCLYPITLTFHVSSPSCSFLYSRAFMLQSVYIPECLCCRVFVFHSVYAAECLYSRAFMLQSVCIPECMYSAVFVSQVV